MTRTMNLSNTQFRYQLVFFIHRYDYYGYIYGWLQVAFGIFCLGKTCGFIYCLGKTSCRHLLPKQKMPSASFDWRHVLPFTTLINDVSVVYRQTLIYWSSEGRSFVMQSLNPCPENFSQNVVDYPNLLRGGVVDYPPPPSGNGKFDSRSSTSDFT